MDKTLILLKIEQYRAEMISLSRKHGLSSHEVIRVSEKLDRLLNKYDKMTVTSNRGRHRGHL